MSESEFHGWQRYAAQRLLPLRRREIYLAQLALYVATSLGGAKDVTLNDFLLKDTDLDALLGTGKAKDQGGTAEEEAAFFEFKPRNKPKEQ